MTTWAKPCPECGGEQQHRPDCPFLERIAARFERIMQRLALLSGARCDCEVPDPLDGFCRECGNPIRLDEVTR